MEPVSTRATTVSEGYVRWADVEAADASPLYAQWARGVAADEVLCTELGQLPQAKRQPNLVFASARVAGVPLTEWAGARRAFHELWPRIRATVLSRATQTNEVRRLSNLVPALDGVDEPIALIEVGASAGLCLYPDKWRYRFGPGKYVGDASRPIIETDASASVPLPAEVPQVAWRAGIDLNPLDAADPSTKEWLEALVWPNQHGEPDGERIDMLRTGLAIARRDPATIIAGDLNDNIEAAIATAKHYSRRVVVWHSAVLVYLDAEARDRFVDRMCASDVLWISNEGRSVVPGEPADWAAPGEFVLRIDGKPMAATNPHGRSITWHTDR